MFLYHYRSIESAKKEIEYRTFHFATREELNDPMEGYVCVYWQGDKSAYEGLFRNYVCSLFKAIELCLLQSDEDILRHQTLIADLHQYDDAPFRDILRDLGTSFLKDEEIRQVVAFCGEQNEKIFCDELKLIIGLIHEKAFSLCIQKGRECGLFPDELAEDLRKYKRSNILQPLLTYFFKEEPNEPDQRLTAAKKSIDSVEDLKDFYYLCYGLDDDNYLYGARKDQNGNVIQETEITQARRIRNWLTVSVDFPKVYLDQLKNLIFPESLVVCFSAKNNDSSMWGHYADNHKGVCLIYETDEENKLTIKDDIDRVLEAKPIVYGGEKLERNFFNTLGGMTNEQIEAWLTGLDGPSDVFNTLKDKEDWMKRYWDAYEAKTYRKLTAWEYEKEYRISIVYHTPDSLGRPESRNLSYDPGRLKGVIFGIKTSEYDKKQIMERLLKHADEFADCKFYQAEYDENTQTIKVREKKLWVEELNPKLEPRELLSRFFDDI